MFSGTSYLNLKTFFDYSLDFVTNNNLYGVSLTPRESTIILKYVCKSIFVENPENANFLILKSKSFKQFSEGAV